MKTFNDLKLRYTSPVQFSYQTCIGEPTKHAKDLTVHIIWIY